MYRTVGIFLSIFLCTTLLRSPSRAEEPVRVFACEPEWAALVSEVGGEKVRVYSATTARQNPHYVRAKPSMLAKIRKAELLVCSGASLEVGWLPILLRRGSADIQRNKLGHLMAADFVETIEKPGRLDRSLGDMHAEGNPHVHLNPFNILLVAEEIHKRLGLIDVGGKAFYQQRYNQFKSRWREAIPVWEKKAETIRAKVVIPHHKNMSYMFEWLGLESTLALEDKPGIPPRMSHLKQLITTFGDNKPHLIVRTPYEPSKPSQWLSDKISVPEKVLPYTIGGDVHSEDLFSLYDRMIDLLVN